MYIIADNCEAKTLAMIRNLGIECEETSLGNSGSFRHMVERILAVEDDDQAVYLLEDDYLHHDGAAVLMEQGLAIADYVTLYDHPDKYRLARDGGNPFNYSELHPVRIWTTRDSHWRETDSTTMTFACRVRTLRQDYHVWEKYTQGRIPRDFKAFFELSQNDPADAVAFLLRKGKRRYAQTILMNWISRRPMRRLISALPARATHAELAHLAPVVDWERL